jgi:hypothetical protein
LVQVRLHRRRDFGAGRWLGFCGAFFGHGIIGNALGVGAAILFFAIVIVGAVTVARITPGASGPVIAGILLADVLVVGMWGDYAARAVGWHGENFRDAQYRDLGSGAGLILPLLYSPPVFGVGVVVGFIARAFVWRKPPPA